MRVAIINTVIGTGSVGRIACGTADEVIRNGGRVLLCRGRGQEVSGYENYRIGSDADMYMHGALSRISDKHGLYSRGATRRLIKRLEEFDPDLIQLHNIHGYYVNYPMLFDWLKGCGKPVVWTLHDCWSFTGHCVHFEYCGCDKWLRGNAVGCFDCPEKNEYPASYFRDASRSNYRIKRSSFSDVPDLHLVTPSEWLKSRLALSFMADYSVGVINTGIDPEAFRPVMSDIRERYGLEDKVLLLGVANPWRERKGFCDFAELYRMLETRAPGRYTVAMIGPQNPGQIRLPEGIIRIGHTDSIEELAGWYSTADIYVNLTYGDTFPTTNIEALACGTPVVTYRTGGSPEILGCPYLPEPDAGEAAADEQTEISDIGAVVPKGDLDRAADSIEAVWERGKKSEPCRERSLKYAKEDKYREYLELYMNVLGSEAG